MCKSVVILLRFQGGSFYGPMVRYKDLLASLRKCIEGPTQLRSYRDIRYSSNKMRNTQNEHQIIVCPKFDLCNCAFKEDLCERQNQFIRNKYL